MAADYAAAKAAAASLLLAQRLYSPRIDVLKLRYRQRIVFDTFENYCANSKAALPQIFKYADMRDGCTVIKRGQGEPVYIVLYNGSVTHPGRRGFTLAHEVGHIVLGHENDGPDREVEANTFAAALLLPPVWVWELLLCSDFRLGVAELAYIFGVSEAAAQNRLRSFSRQTPPVFTDEEKQLLQKFGGLLPQLDGPVVDI